MNEKYRSINMLDTAAFTRTFEDEYKGRSQRYIHINGYSMRTHRWEIVVVNMQKHSNPEKMMPV